MLGSRVPQRTPSPALLRGTPSTSRTLGRLIQELANFLVGGLDATLPMQMFNEMRWSLTPVVAAIAAMLILLTSVALWLAARGRRAN